MGLTLTSRELIDERRVLDEFLLEAEGELTPELEALLIDVDAKIEHKIEGIGRFVLSERARAAAIREEEQRLTARRKAIENRVAFNLEVRLPELMATLGVLKYKGMLVSVGFQSNPPSVKGELDEHILRELASHTPELVRYTPEQFAIDRRAALEYAKAGHTLPDGLTVEQTSSLRIR